MDKTYTAIARFYDLLMQNVDYVQWFEYIYQLMSQARREIKDVMDLACGTGNMTGFLLQAGYNVHGLDSSRQMLEVAKHKLPGVKFFLGDFLNWGIDESYDAVICVFDSLNNLLVPQEVFLAFKEVLKHLRPGGVFVFDLNTRYGLKQYWGNNFRITKDENMVVLWRSRSIKPGFSQLRITVFAKENDRWQRAADEVHTERGYDSPEVIKMMLQAGFRVARAYDHLTLNPPAQVSGRISYVGIR